MKAKFAISFFLLAVASQKIIAEEKLRPLIEVVAQEQSLHMYNYVFQRCSGLMLEISLRAGRGVQTEQAKQFSELMKLGYEQFAFLSADLISQIKKRAKDDPRNTNEALDVIMKLQNKYFDEMEEYYTLTGNSIDEKAQSDLTLCNSILQN